MYKNIISQSGFSMDRLANFCAVADVGSFVGAAKGVILRAVQPCLSGDSPDQEQ